MSDARMSLSPGAMRPARRSMARALGYAEARSTEQTPEIATGRAVRPADASLDSARAESLLVTPMQGFDEALRLVIECKGEKEL